MECLECGKNVANETDLELCQTCMRLFDVERLWREHDNSQLDALDFNESDTMREQYRIGR